MACCLKSKTAESIINCLLHIPFVGLTSAVMSKIIAEEEQTIVLELCRLQGMGIVAAIESLFTEDKLYYIHDVVRSLRDDATCDNGALLRWRQTYLFILKEKLSREKLTTKDLLPCLDAWVSGWASVFDKGSIRVGSTGFFETFQLI
jgi:hypothetical protein